MVKWTSRSANPYDTPLIIHAFFPKKYTLRVELLGRDPPGKVEHKYAVIRSHEFYRRVWTKPHLAPGRKLKRQARDPWLRRGERRDHHSTGW